MDFRQVLRQAPQLEYTMCPHCRKRGENIPMKYIPEMSFRNFALYECPKCGTTLDKQIEKQPKLIRPPYRSKVYVVPR